MMLLTMGLHVSSYTVCWGSDSSNTLSMVNTRGGSESLPLAGLRTRTSLLLRSIDTILNHSNGSKRVSRAQWASEHPESVGLALVSPIRLHLFIQHSSVDAALHCACTALLSLSLQAHATDLVFWFLISSLLSGRQRITTLMFSSEAAAAAAFLDMAAGATTQRALPDSRQRQSQSTLVGRASCTRRAERKEKGSWHCELSNRVQQHQSQRVSSGTQQREAHQESTIDDSSTHSPATGAAGHCDLTRTLQPDDKSKSLKKSATVLKTQTTLIVIKARCCISRPAPFLLGLGCEDHLFFAFFFCSLCWSP